MKIGLVITYILIFILTFFLSFVTILFITSNSIEDTNANLKIAVLQDDINTYLSKQRIISSLQQDFTLTMARFNLRINELELNLTSNQPNSCNCNQLNQNISQKESKLLKQFKLLKIIEVVKELDNLQKKIQTSLQLFNDLKTQISELEHKINYTDNKISLHKEKITLLNTSIFQQSFEIKQKIDLSFKKDKTRIEMISIWKNLIEKMIKHSIIQYVNITDYHKTNHPCIDPNLSSIKSNICSLNNQSQLLYLFKKISSLQKELISRTNSLSTHNIIIPSISSPSSSSSSSPLTIKYSIHSLVDYALFRNGAQIIENLTSPTYSPENIFPPSFKDIALSFIGISPLIGGPQEAITDELSLGHCWAMKGSKGNLTIHLSESIKITSITVEHIQREDAIDISSAPSTIEVYGLKNLEEQENRLLAIIHYDINSMLSTQHFLITNDTNESFPYVQVHIVNNHGNSQYTCLYRIQIHGIPYHLLN